MNQKQRNQNRETARRLNQKVQRQKEIRAHLAKRTQSR